MGWIRRAHRRIAPLLQPAPAGASRPERRTWPWRRRAGAVVRGVGIVRTCAKTIAQVAELATGSLDAVCRRDDPAVAVFDSRADPCAVGGSALHAPLLWPQHGRGLRRVR